MATKPEIECLLRLQLSTLEAFIAGGGGGGGGGGTGVRIVAPFVSSNGVLLDDARGVVGDWLYDPADPGFYYMKVDTTPDTWIEFSVGTILHS